jgi:RsiW-degrading membrane proteinase PrsW (M82 family)
MPVLEALSRPVFLGWWDCVYSAFRLYVIPAEVAKFVVLAAFLFFNKYYDEYVDAIVYSVCIALAFIGLKNGWFLYFHADELYLRSFLTALVLIPAHFTIGTIMGYFFGLARLRRKKVYYAVALLASILADGLFCSLFLWIDDQMSYYIIAIIALVILGIFMHSIAHHSSIEHLISEDISNGNTKK